MAGTMKLRRVPLSCLLPLLAAACGSLGGTGGAGATGGASASLRDSRFCEIQVGTAQGSTLHIDVYSTQSLDDCPEDAWSKLTAASIQAQTMSQFVALDGPRYWVVDSLQGSVALDPTVQTFGGIEMHESAALDVAAGASSTVGMPYLPHTVERHSDYHYLAGEPVYELVDPSAKAYVMQSYSTQDKAQTEASLAGLGAALTLPSGWSFRTRVLTTTLVEQATNGSAVVVLDDFANNYVLE
jgi:hypothetical protein